MPKSHRTPLLSFTVIYSSFFESRNLKCCLILIKTCLFSLVLFKLVFAFNNSQPYQHMQPCATGTDGEQEEEKINEALFVWSETSLLNRKSILSLCISGCRNVLLICWWNSLPSPDRTQCKHTKKKKKKQRGVCILSFLYFSLIFTKTWTGEGKAFQ